MSRSCGGARGEGRRAATADREEEEAAAAAVAAVFGSERLAWRADCRGGDGERRTV